ncbi:MAG: hypothetical protein AAF614_30690 [Chloroflexota bacterium]
MSFPIVAILLASQGELDIGSERRHLRLFLVQEDENQGVGIQWTRPRLFESECLKTNLGYIMWVGEGENATYCQCVDAQTNTLGSSGGC